MNIRPATLADARGIAEAHVGAWQAAYRGIVADGFLDQLEVPERERRWADVVRDPTCTLLVAREGGQVLGFVSFGRSREEHSGADDGEIWTLYVAPSSWRRGVGRALMQEALATLRGQGFSAVWVWVLVENGPAVDFYVSCGFVLQPGSRRLFELGGQSLAEVALVRQAA